MARVTTSTPYNVLCSYSGNNSAFHPSGLESVYEYQATHFSALVWAEWRTGNAVLLIYVNYMN